MVYQMAHLSFAAGALGKKTAHDRSVPGDSLLKRTEDSCIFIAFEDYLEGCEQATDTGAVFSPADVLAIVHSRCGKNRH
jgi:hypothetical protein